MTDYIIVGIVASITVLLLLLVVRFRFGDSLMTRLFSFIMPAMGATCYTSFVLGKQGGELHVLAFAVLVSVVCVVTMIAIIQHFIVNRIKKQADSIYGVVSNLSTTSQQAAASAEEQASTVNQVTSSVEEIHQMSKSTAEISQRVVNLADEAVDQGHKGLDSVQKVVGIMERFSQATDFVQVVGEVAEQSNLLAVNAGIEAAKAADHGQGFSVVATEVRNLAEQSKEAASQIRQAINQTSAGQTALTDTEKVINSLAEVLKEASDRARQISGASMQQSAGIKQIFEAMGNLSQGGRDTANTSQHIKKAISELTDVSQQLALLVAKEHIKNQKRI